MNLTLSGEENSNTRGWALGRTWYDGLLLLFIWTGY